MCSETEVTNGSSEAKNGFNAFRYLKEGRLKNTEEEIPIPDTMNAPNVKIEFLIRVAWLLNVWTINNNTMKIVGKRTRTPP